MIYGDGEQSRGFTFVKNIVDANILSCESKETRIFNITYGRRITVNELVYMINEILEKNIKVKHMDLKLGDLSTLWQKYQKLKNLDIIHLVILRTNSI